MNKNSLWIIPALFIAYILYEKYVLSKTFSVFFKGLNFNNMSLMNPAINLEVQVNNPTPVTAEVQQIRGDLYVEGQQVGTVLGITPTVLQSGSSTLSIPVTLSYVGVANLIEKLSSGNQNFSYKFTGTIMVDYIVIPLEFGYPTANG
jgi:LEA14-like dessication related protein